MEVEVDDEGDEDDTDDAGVRSAVSGGPNTTDEAVVVLSSAKANGMSCLIKYETPDEVAVVVVLEVGGVLVGVVVVATVVVVVATDGGVEVGAGVEVEFAVGVDVAPVVVAVVLVGMIKVLVAFVVFVLVAVVVATDLEITLVEVAVDVPVTTEILEDAVVVEIVSVVELDWSVDVDVLGDATSTAAVDVGTLEVGVSPICQTSVSPTFVICPDVAKLVGKNPPQKTCESEAAYNAELLPVKEVLAVASVSGAPSAFAGFCQLPRQVDG